MSKFSIAFIGLGNMGSPMAQNLLKHGHDVRVFDLSADAVQKMVDAGATAFATVEETAQGANVVISMLPAGHIVKSIYIGENQTGLLSKLSPDTLVIDSSTISASDAREVAEVAKQFGISFVDAPVSGGTAGAAAGTLTFIVGGETETFEQVKPVLACMGKNIFHAGGHGAGQVAKICNNMLLGILMAGTAEMLNLGVKNGLDAKTLSDIMLQSSGRNWTLEVYNPYPNVMENVPSSRGYTGGFMSKLMLKDLNLALQTAQESNVNVPMGQRVTDLYQQHVEQFADVDFSSILAHYHPDIFK